MSFGGRAFPAYRVIVIAVSAVLIAARFILGLSEGPILPISQSLMVGATSPGRSATGCWKASRNG